MLEVVHEDERCVMAMLRNVAFVGWRDAPTVELIRKWHDLGRTLAKAHPGTSACVDLVVSGTPRFTDAVRKETEKFAGDPGIFPIGFAHILIIPGFAGTAVRAFIGTILLVSRAPAPAKVFGSIAPATQWLVPKLAATGWTASELARGCEDLAARLEVP